MSNKKLGVTRRAFMYLAGLTALPFGQSVLAHNENNRSDGMIVVRVLFPVSAGTDIGELKKKIAATAVKYVRYIEELIEAPVSLLSTSPERNDAVLVHDPFAD